jgi:ADP-heptose:LPS heptosyltransferase
MDQPRFPVLFITSSRIGDAVLTSGLLQRIVEEAPHTVFTIAAGPLTAPLFKDTPGLEKLVPFERKPFSGHWFDLWSEARKRRWGLVLDMRGSALARFLNARRRAVKKPAPAGAPLVHKVIEAARVLRIEDDPPAPFLYTSPETEARAEALTQGSGPILALAPAANWVGKTWPAERFARVARELLGPGGPLARGRLMVVGGPADRRDAGPVLSAAPRDRVIDLVGREDLLVVHAALARARLFVGGDSGLMHLAAAAGAPTIGLFGPSDERLYGPWGPRARAVRGSRPFEAFRRIDPKLNQALSHMMDLNVETVVRAAHDLLIHTETPPA